MQVYDDLKNALIALIDRDDYVVANAVGGGTTDKAEEWLLDASRRFYRTDAARTPPFELYITGTVTAGTNIINIPTDFRELRRITVSDGIRTQAIRLDTSDELLTKYDSALVDLPYRFSREGGAWFIDACSQDITYTIYYYGTLTPVSEITTTTYPVTVSNYNLNKLERLDAGTSLFFPTGTTTAQAESDYASLTPTLASTGANTQEYFFSGVDIVHWLLNDAPEILIYYAGAEAARYYDITDGSLQEWEAIAEKRVVDIIRDFERLDSSGTTPKMKRPSLYTR